MTANVVFRVNASSSVGLGHVVRCRALAEELTARGATCTMVGPSRTHSIPLDQGIFGRWTPITDWEDEISDAQRLLDIVDEVGADRLVLDDYRVRVAYQRELSAAGAPPWLQAAPREGEEIRARWIYNANPSAREEVYRAAAVDPAADYLIGPRYALLRREFRNAPRLRRVHETSPQVLIAFGGGDDRGAVAFSLEALKPILDRIRVVVLSGPGNPANAEIQGVLARSPAGSVSLRVGPPRVAELFASSHVGLLAAGTATFEAAACGLPMVLVPISNNQEGQALAWQHLGIATSLNRYGVASPEDICLAVRSLLDNPDERAKRESAARRLVDGEGSSRVAGALLGV